jgi:hypothetical protein
MEHAFSIVREDPNYEFREVSAHGDKWFLRFAFTPTKGIYENRIDKIEGNE